MAEKYLDLTGLGQFLSRLNNKFVDKTSDQTISGLKTFHNIKIDSATDNGIIFAKSDYNITLGTPSTNNQLSFYNENSSNEQILDLTKSGTIATVEELPQVLRFI